jgi:hypothetical protein
MSKTMDRSPEFIKDQYKKGFNIEFVGFEQLTLDHCMKHLQEKMGYEYITSDLGVNYVADYLKEERNPENIPFDSMWVSIFRGNVSLLPTK